MNIDDYKNSVNLYMNDHPEQRYGQALFNVLDIEYPELSKQIIGSMNDPFYYDYKIPNFFIWLEKVEKIRLKQRAIIIGVFFAISIIIIMIACFI